MKPITPRQAIEQMDSLIDEAVNIRCYDDVMMALTEARQLVTAMAKALDAVMDIAVFDADHRQDDELAEMLLSAANAHGVAWMVPEVAG
jgi:transcriptional regulator CtsR